MTWSDGTGSTALMSCDLGFYYCGPCLNCCVCCYVTIGDYVCVSVVWFLSSRSDMIKHLILFIFLFHCPPHCPYFSTIGDGWAISMDWIYCLLFATSMWFDLFIFVLFCQRSEFQKLKFSLHCIVKESVALCLLFWTFLFALIIFTIEPVSSF